MGRHAYVPLESGKVVKTSRVGQSAETPHHPDDINWEALERITGERKIPRFKDNIGNRG